MTAVNRRGFKSGLDSKVTAVLGGQWGDEGKGKLADVLAQNYDIVGRFNGGANAGHTVVANGKKYAFHLLPCGLIYDHTINLLGNGVVVDLDAMFEELKPLDDVPKPDQGSVADHTWCRMDLSGADASRSRIVHPCCSNSIRRAARDGAATE